MDTNLKNPKNPKTYLCETCNFISCNKKDYYRHIITVKHKTLTNPNLKTLNPEKTPLLNCICGNSYKHSSSLCAHKKKCFVYKNIEKYNEPKLIEPTDKQLIMMLIKENSELKNFMIEQSKETNEFKNIVLEQQNNMMEVIKNGTNNTTTNSHNKTFNLQFFLNETCKDAMNIMEFVDSIKLQLSDLEKVGEIGYVEGISNIITTNLKALDVTQRPIHCTDKKRETLYIKDEDKWEKENEEKKKLRKVIKKVANKNIMLLQKFKEVHPDCGKSASKYSDQYNKIIIESMDTDKENENKIIKNISNITTIDK
jgi:hypothetical protein